MLKIDCLWCHHFQRSRESCGTEKLSLKRLPAASKWAAACRQCPVKWLVTTAADTREESTMQHTVCVWHACRHSHAEIYIYIIHSSANSIHPLDGWWNQCQYNVVVVFLIKNLTVLWRSTMSCQLLEKKRNIDRIYGILSLFKWLT